MKFKFQAKDSFLEYFFWTFGDLKKRIALSEKKPPLAHGFRCVEFQRFVLPRTQDEGIKIIEKL